MNKLVILLPLLGLVYLASAQVPRPCVSPVQFEAKIVEVVPDRKEDVFARLYYDALMQRSRVIDVVYVNDTREIYDRLFLHQVNLEYRLDVRTKKCEVRPLTYPFRRFEVPPGAKYLGQAYVGGSVVGEGVLVAMWNGTTPDRKGTIRGSWTELGCVPVGVGVFFPQHGSFISHFFDVTLGISNPDVFIPPKECTQANDFHYDAESKVIKYY